MSQAGFTCFSMSVFEFDILGEGKKKMKFWCKNVRKIGVITNNNQNTFGVGFEMNWIVIFYLLKKVCYLVPNKLSP